MFQRARRVAEAAAARMKFQPVSDSRRWQLYVCLGLLILWVLAFLVEIDLLVFRGSLRDWLKPDRVLPAVGVLSGFLLLLWQLDRQHRGALLENRQEARLKLRVEIYRDLSAASEAASRALLDHLRAVVETVMDGAQRARVPPSAFSRGQSDDALINRQHATASAIAAMIAAIERWEIALGDDARDLIDVLGQGLDTFQGVARVFNSEAAKFFDVPRGAAGEPARLRGLSDHGERAQEADFELASTLGRLRVTIQNVLLEEVFLGRTIFARESDLKPYRLPDSPHT